MAPAFLIVCLHIVVSLCSPKVNITAEAVEKPLSSNKILPIPSFRIVVKPAYDILEP